MFIALNVCFLDKFKHIGSLKWGNIGGKNSQMLYKTAVLWNVENFTGSTYDGVPFSQNAG